MTQHSWVNASLTALVRIGLKHTTLEEQLLVWWPVSLCLDSWLPAQRVVQRSVLQCSIGRARTHLPVPVCVSKVQATLKSASAENQGPKPIHGPLTHSFSTALGREQTETVITCSGSRGRSVYFWLVFLSLNRFILVCRMQQDYEFSCFEVLFSAAVQLPDWIRGIRTVIVSAMAFGSVSSTCWSKISRSSSTLHICNKTILSSPHSSI